ncbi:hypothetical protein [Abyssisolibacter fermentans]|uniref:hypothetical protein n=1 Tax=Abyssisolibacter fermentans TaxID=1766203 RepID=UPI000830CCD6|nr:hypothetical protein [Abyssisolibacter fermentans]
MKTKKYLSIVTICFILFTSFTTVFASSDLGTSSFSQEEINDHFNKKFDDISRYMPKSNSSIYRSGTTSELSKLEYLPEYTEIDPEAFPLIKVYFDNTGGEWENFTVTYSEGHTVTWNVAVNTATDVKIEASFVAVKTEIAQSLGLTVSRESSTNKAIGCSGTARITERKKGYIPIYAAGVKTGGQYKYDYINCLGQHEIVIKNRFEGVIPYEETKYTSVTFGRPVYTW